MFYSLYQSIVLLVVARPREKTESNLVVFATAAPKIKLNLYLIHLRRPKWHHTIRHTPLWGSCTVGFLPFRLHPTDADGQKLCSRWEFSKHCPLQLGEYWFVSRRNLHSLKCPMVSSSRFCVSSWLCNQLCGKHNWGFDSVSHLGNLSITTQVQMNIT